MIWFNHYIWCGKRITIPGEPDATWILGKLRGRSSQRPEHQSIDLNAPSMAWAVFSRVRKNNEKEKFAMKIWMQ